jgi:hypothetical protein
MKRRRKKGRTVKDEEDIESKGKIPVRKSGKTGQKELRFHFRREEQISFSKLNMDSYGKKRAQKNRQDRC